MVTPNNGVSRRCTQVLTSFFPLICQLVPMNLHCQNLKAKSTQGFNNMYGDFSVEYNINKAGTWKLKAYTYVGERDENYIYDAQINYTAGVAVAFKQDFNSTPRRKNKSNPKQRKNKKDEQH